MKNHCHSNHQVAGGKGGKGGRGNRGRDNNRRGGYRGDRNRDDRDGGGVVTSNASLRRIAVTSKTMATNAHTVPQAKKKNSFVIRNKGDNNNEMENRAFFINLFLTSLKCGRQRTFSNF
ncbi:MAG: hypothetical protein ACLS5G_01995 [Streptococcus sp.]